MCIQEHQIQVGTKTQLQSAQAAVADDGEATAGHFAMCAGHVGTRHFQHRHHHRIGKLGKLMGAIHRALAAIVECQRHAETQREAHFVERAQGCFRVIDGQGGSAGIVHFLRFGHRPGHARVQQFVQQQRERNQPLGQQRAARQHVDQTGKCAGLFVEQGEVAGAAQDGLQQAQHAAQCCIRLR
ncbi:hypothetical protein D3C81_985300 [compost metagenome]